MKKYILILLLIMIPVSFVFSEVTDSWNTSKSTHFIVFYKNAPEEFIEKLINRSEEYYDLIAEGLGFRRYDFWLWDNRAKVYVYDDAKEFQSAGRQPQWSAGAAIPKEKTIYTFFPAEGFLENILPHEIGHIIFREFVGFYNPAIPGWLDEGVASYQEDSKRSDSYVLLRQVQSIDNVGLIPLDKLSAVDLKAVTNPETARLFYAEAVSIVDYLIKEYGEDNFALFCAGLRDKKNLLAAISSVYPFSSIEELNRGWQKYLKQE